MGEKKLHEDDGLLSYQITMAQVLSSRAPRPVLCLTIMLHNAALSIAFVSADDVSHLPNDSIT